MSHHAYGARDGMALIRATHAGDLDIINEIVEGMSKAELIATLGGVTCVAAVYAEALAHHLRTDVGDVIDRNPGGVAMSRAVDPTLSTRDAMALIRAITHGDHAGASHFVNGMDSAERTMLIVALTNTAAAWGAILSELLDTTPDHLIDHHLEQMEAEEE